MQAVDRAPVLFHGEQPHAVRGVVVEAHLRLCRADRVRERAAAGYDKGTACAASDCGNPMPYVGRERETPAQLDDCRTAAHLGCGFRIAKSCCGIEMMHLRHLDGAFAHNFDPDAARDAGEVFCLYGTAVD